MALVNCIECFKKVSSMAEACPHCGAPIKNPPKNFYQEEEVLENSTPDSGPDLVHQEESPHTTQQVTTIEATSKNLKFNLVCSVILIVVCTPWLFTTIIDHQHTWELILPVLCVGGGIVFYFVTRFKIWWHHK